MIDWLPLRPVLVGIACFLLLLVAVAMIAALFSAEPGRLLTGLAEIIKALAWPAVTALVLTTFKTPLASQFGRVRKIAFPGTLIELDQIVDQKLQDAASEVQAQSIGQTEAISSADLDRARAIGRVTTTENLPEVKTRMMDLALRYREIRGTIARGDERTRAMAVIVAQMRALGQAAFPLRGEFAFSDDPGKRLTAIAIAQVQPDFTMLGWIASRVGPGERAFIQYHATEALLMAARNADIAQSVNLAQAYHIAKSGYESLPERRRMKRPDLLDEIGKEVERLSTASS